MSTDTKPTLEVLNQQIAVLEEELASLTPRVDTIRKYIRNLREQKRQPLGSDLFIWKDKSYLISKIIHKRQWAWNSDPYCGGCAEPNGRRIELVFVDGRVGAIAQEESSDGGREYRSMLREFEDQFGIALTKVVPLTDDGGKNVHGW